jgi:hypothetical protein
MPMKDRDPAANSVNGVFLTEAVPRKHKKQFSSD